MYSQEIADKVCEAVQPVLERTVVALNPVSNAVEVVTHETPEWWERGWAMNDAKKGEFVQVRFSIHPLVGSNVRKRNW